jgi:4'-phosphopantetheinyl transferase
MMYNFSKPHITQNEVHVFRSYFPEITKKNLSMFGKILSSLEKLQIDKLINNSLKKKYIISHDLLRYLLSSYLDLELQNIEYSENLFGNPFLKNNTGIQFSMSHSENYIAYVIALDHPVGDIEWKNAHIDLDGAPELAFSNTELSS